MADIPIVLVIFALIGATLNVLRGAASSPLPFSWKLFGGALIAATTASITLLQFVDVNAAAGPVGLAIFGLLAGFTGDFVASKSKQQ